MARNDNIYIQCSYKDSIELGNVNSITARFSNLIFTEYGRLTSVRFESEQFGILNLEKQFDGSYQINFMVPEDPKFYPIVEGNLMIYDYSKIIGQYSISFQTNFELKADILVTGNGPGGNAATVLEKAGLEIYIGANDMTVKEAFDAYQSDKLKQQ